MTSKSRTGLSPFDAANTTAPSATTAGNAQPLFRVLIVDCTNHNYNGIIIQEKPLGGIPIVTVALAETLAKHGCQVTVINNTQSLVVVNGVSWIPRDQDHDFENIPDIIIANNDMRLLFRYTPLLKQGAKPVIWLHNLLTLKRLIKKKRLLPLLRWRPAIVFLGNYHAKACVRFLPFRKRTSIPHGVADQFFGLRAEQDKTSLRPHNPPTAIFTSHAFRGLDEVVECWIKYVHPHLPEARLHAYVGEGEAVKRKRTAAELLAANIDILPRLPQVQLMQKLMDADCMVYAGHKDETFCNAAAEATVLQVPVITRGIGSLSERIENGVNGYVCRSDAEMGQTLCRVLSDNTEREKLFTHMFDNREQYRWDNRVPQWLDLFSSLTGKPAGFFTQR